MVEDNQNEDNKNMGIGCLALIVMFVVGIWFFSDAEWEEKGFDSEEQYEEFIAGGFEDKNTFLQAKTQNITSASDWVAYVEAERLAREQEEAKAVERKKLLASPDWRRLDSAPAEFRGFIKSTNPDVACKVKFIDSMRVYQAIFFVHTTDTDYLISYRRPAKTSPYYGARAWSNPQNNQEAIAHPIVYYEYRLSDGDVFYLKLRGKKNSKRFDFERIYKVTQEGILTLNGYVRNGTEITSDKQTEELINDAPGTSFEVGDVSGVGIRDIGMRDNDGSINFFDPDEKCSLSDYSDIASEKLWVNKTQQTTTLAAIAQEM